MKMYNCSNKRRVLASQTVVALMAVAVSFNAFSRDDITAFRLTGIEGHVEVRYSDDEQSTRSGGISLFGKTRTLIEEEIYLLTHSYIYHPRFLMIDLGLGPSFQQKHVDSSTGDVDENESPYNVDARLRFLEGKPYPLTLFYSRKNQAHGESLDRIESRYTRQGYNFNLRKSFIPADINIEGSRAKSEGTGFDYRYDDSVDLFNFRSTIPTGEHGNHQLNYNNREVTSRTGRLSLPVQQSVLKAESATLNSRLSFGDLRQLRLSNNISYQIQENSRSLKDLRLSPILHWQHSDDLRSYYRFNYLDNEQNQVTSQNRSMAAGFQHQMSEDLGYAAELHSNNSEITGSALTSYGTSTSVNSSHKLSFGRLGLSAGARYDVYDRVVSANPQIVGESHILTGTTPVQLSRDHSVAATIRVFEVFPGGTEQERTVGTGSGCSAGFDILLLAIGVKTEILNCNGIAGVDMQVKVDYEYDPGGTVEYATFSHNYQANLDLFRYYKVYVRFSDSNNSIRSGFSTLPLDEVQSMLFVAQVDYPLHGIVNLGSKVTHEKQNGTFTSFDRDTVNFYAQFAIWSGNLMLSHDRVQQDYIGVSQDTDMVRNRLNFRAHPWKNISISLELSDEEDTGGSVPRRSSFQNLAFDWSIRKLKLRAEARFAQDEYGFSERDHSKILLTLRRDF